MKKLKNLRSSLGKVIVISVLVGFVTAVILAHMILAFYIVECEDITDIEKYLDEEPEKSIRGGY